MHKYRILFEAKTVGGRLRNIEVVTEADSFLDAIGKAETEARERYTLNFGDSSGSLLVQELTLIT